MPFKDGTGPNGNGPKKDNKGVPTPRRERRQDGSGSGKWGNSSKKRGGGKRNK